MEYSYAELIRAGQKTLETISKRKVSATAVLLIISKDKTIEDVPETYKTETLEKLAAQGYNGYGELLTEE